MTTTLTSDQQLEADIAALNAHAESIREPHRTAWAQDAAVDYLPGAIVWMWDHFNTGVVVGPSSNRTWTVRTTDVNGIESTFQYKAEWLRPAVEARVFTW